MAGKKLKGLDRELFDRWEVIDKSHRYPLTGSFEDAIERIEKEALEFTELLAVAHRNGQWQVGSFVASLISVSLWFRYMMLMRYGEAQAIMELCLTHPEPFDRRGQAVLPVRLLIAKLVDDLDGSVAGSLKEWIHCGVYRPNEMAAYIRRDLLQWVADQKWDVEVTPGVRELALALASTKKQTKKVLSYCQEIHIWNDFDRALHALDGYTILE